ncbi:MAG: esterase family protein [Lewinellaceae bacterium]|nr:esterase family protein [Lewinellaceae bacterium]
MQSTAILLLSLGFFTAGAQQQPSPAAGSLRRFDNFPSNFVDPRTVEVWLPDGYNTKKKYAVLYMHDGQMLFDSTTTWNKQEWGVDETMGRLLAESKIRDCIVVGIWNNGPKRHSEYFPQKPFEALTTAQREALLQEARSAKNPLFSEKIQSDNYLRFLVQELKPFVDKQFSTHKNRKNTFIAGSSMGGLISLYAICEYPKVFGGAACLSTHWTGIFRAEDNPVPAAFMQYLEKKLPTPRTHKIYFDHGTATLDALYPPFQQQADAVLRARGFTDKNWITRVFEGADHSEKAWQQRLEIPVVFCWATTERSSF